MKRNEVLKLSSQDSISSASSMGRIGQRSIASIGPNRRATGPRHPDFDRFSEKGRTDFSSLWTQMATKTTTVAPAKTVYHRPRPWEGLGSDLSLRSAPTVELRPPDTLILTASRKREGPIFHHFGPKWRPRRRPLLQSRQYIIGLVHGKDWAAIYRFDRPQPSS